MGSNHIKIGGASGYWGENVMATSQLLQSGNLDYIVYDYLAEITMSIMARAKSKNPEAGYATDFISYVLQPNLIQIAKNGVKIISNAGGVNPESCGAAARALIKDLGLDLKVAVISGDNLLSSASEIAANEPDEMFTGAAFPSPDKIASINCYLGAFPIAKALDMGADIVITGRCVDSAVTLGACIHEFGWSETDYNELASGSLAGHILECGPQATGGNFTDWEEAGDIAEIGYPIAEISRDGSFILTKPEGTTGLVSRGTISEQMLYEIGDPQAYFLPDVVCDFSDVAIDQIADNQVRISPASGKPAPDTYKTCATYADGFRTGTTVSFYGFDADKKAEMFSDAIFSRAQKTLRYLNAAEFTETSVEIIGAETQFGHFKKDKSSREVVLKIAAKHPTPMEGGVLLKELVGLGLASPPGLSGFQGGRAKPSPVVRLFSYLTSKSNVEISIDFDGKKSTYSDSKGQPFEISSITRPSPPIIPDDGTEMIQIPLIKLAWARSGDKGDKANIGIIAREQAYLPYIWNTLSIDVVAKRFAHFIEGGADSTKIEKYFLPGSNAINFLIDQVLGGGGVASIRNDAQGKGFSQILLAHPISIPAIMAVNIS